MTQKVWTALVSTLVLSCGLALGQTATGSLSGTIKDSAGAVVPGAKLAATNVATGEQSKPRRQRLDYTRSITACFNNIAEKTGFKKLNRQNIEVRVAQRVDLDLSLEIGDVQQTVEVSAEAPLEDAPTAERGQNLSTKFMDNLLLFSGGIRNPRAFVNYMSGVTNAGEQSVSGSGGRAQEVLIDGGSALNVESSAVFNFPSSEMFSEFKMLQSNYSAEYGRVGGGMKSTRPKAGRNWFHGAAFHNMRRDIWNANAWNRNARRRTLPLPASPQRTVQ